VRRAGAAVADGAAILVFLDGDYADDPADPPLVLGPILDDAADLVLGTCLDRRERGALPPHQIVGNRVATILMVLLGCAVVTPFGVPRGFTMRAAVCHL